MRNAGNAFSTRTVATYVNRSLTGWLFGRITTMTGRQAGRQLGKEGRKEGIRMSATPAITNATSVGLISSLSILHAG